MNITAFLAIRLGSNRIPYKNFRILNGKPLYSYLTDTALCCKSISRLFINSDSNLVLDIARQRYKNNLSYYLRSPHLGTSEATLDDYVYDFMLSHKSDYTIFLNPCSLFLRSETIDRAVEYTLNNNLDSCVASYEVQTHCFFNNFPVNFSFQCKQPRSQDLTPVHAMTSGFFIWKNSSFINSYETHEGANFNGAFYSFPVSRLESIDIDIEDDFDEACRLLSGVDNKSSITYVPQIQSLVDQGSYCCN